MICPACKSDMIDVEHASIELDYCTDCRGVWFDAEELELLLGSLGLDGHGLPLADILHTPEAETPEKKRRCSICGQKMKKMALGDKPKEIIIDVCPQGHGLWFDGGEVSHLLQQLAKKQPLAGDKSGQRVVSFLGEVFQAQD